MAVSFCGQPRTFMSASAGSARPAACLSNGGLNLPTLNGFPSQIETCAPAIYFDNCKSQLIGIQSTGATGWAAGGNLITSINQGNGGGTQNSSYVYGGTTGTGNPAVTTTQEYNGSTWATGGALPAARRLLFRGCVGTQNAGLAVFGFSASPGQANQCTSYEYNGTTWATGGNGAITVRNGSAFGTQNSATAAGGFTTTQVTCTQEYNGTSWSGGGNLIGARESNGGAGTSQNTGWSTGGGPGPVTCTETYNGTSWSTSGALPAARQLGGTSGRQCYGFWAGGADGPNTCGQVYLFDGYVWRSTCNLITAVSCNAAGGDGTEGVMFSGYTGAAVSNTTQEFNNPFLYYQLGT
jgi:hypothetical protein